MQISYRKNRTADTCKMHVSAVTLRTGASFDMREGILIPDMHSGRADIRFNSDDCYGGLHCGTTMDIWLNEQWVPTRIEMDSRGWFLVGVQIETLWGQRVRIRW